MNEVIFTSGCHGEPKGVMHTPNTGLAALYPLIERLAFTERDVLLMASTLGHQTGYLYSHCLNLLLGSTVVWMDVWNAEEAARVIEAERVTFTMGATPFLRDLTLCADGARPELAPRVHLRGRAHSAPAREGRARATPVCHLRGLGHDGERARELQRARRSGGESGEHRRLASLRHAPPRGGRGRIARASWGERG